MSFESELSELIASVGLAAPDVGERREVAWPKIIAAFQHLIRVAKAAAPIGVQEQLRIAQAQQETQENFHQMWARRQQEMQQDPRIALADALRGLRL